MSDPARKTEVEVMKPQAGAVVQTPMDMIARAIETGAGMETVEKLMGLQERWEKNQARKAFDEAMAVAKADMPVIVKNREVDFTSAKGRTNYRHEDMAGIARQVDPILARNGLSYRFRTSSLPNEPVTVTCIISHRLGHSEENSLTAGRDESGNKNSIQAVGSTVTYLQRYTLKAALGLSASTDDDAKSVEPVETITADDVQNLRDMLKAKGAPEAPFLKWAKVSKIEDIPADYYDSCVEAIKNFKGAAK